MKIKKEYLNKSISHNKRIIEVNSIDEKQFPYFIKTHPELFDKEIDSDLDIIALTDGLCDEDECNEYIDIKSSSTKSKNKRK